MRHAPRSPLRSGCVVAGASALLLALGGCGDAPTRAARAPGTSPPAPASHEHPSPPVAPETATSAAPSPLEAIRDFAAGYINWTADDVAQRMRTLAAASVGQARAAMQLTAAQTAGDYELQRGGITNSGTVEAVAPLAGRADRYVVVTRETTTASHTTAYQGLRPAWHVVLAKVAQLGSGRWVVSTWQPQN